MSSILITGGTGLVGTRLAKLLSQNEHQVSLLSRSSGNSEHKTFIWNPEKKIFPIEALKNVDFIVHLAGSGIADKYWTKKYKEKIVRSRVDSANLIFEVLKNNPHQVKCFISASATGYYGESGETWVDETRPPADDFLGNTCKVWEKSAMQFETLGMRVVILRTGIVLAKEDGAVKPMALSVKLFAGAAFGDGEQYMPWIHLDDLCREYEFAISNQSLHGAYNAVAPSPVKNSFFVKTLGKVLHRPIWPINIPGFVLKTILGEKAVVVLQGQRVTNEKIRQEGFAFKYNDVRVALEEVLKSNEVE